MLKRFQTTILIVLVALWVPATSWCLLERAGWAGPHDDGSAVGESPQSCVCCVLSSAPYKFDGNQRVAVSFSGNSPALLVSPVESQTDQSACAESGVSPPEICASWQFSFRAASAPRAPSFAS
jgi:hypothetical protein